MMQMCRTCKTVWQGKLEPHQDSFEDEGALSMAVARANEPKLNATIGSLKSNFNEGNVG